MYTSGMLIGMEKKYYSTAGAKRDPTGASSGSDRVYRDGSWYDYANYCRVAFRLYYYPSYSSYYIGFRPVSTESE